MSQLKYSPSCQILAAPVELFSSIRLFRVDCFWPYETCRFRRYARAHTDTQTDTLITVGLLRATENELKPKNCRDSNARVGESNERIHGDSAQLLLRVRRRRANLPGYDSHSILARDVMAPGHVTEFHLPWVGEGEGRGRRRVVTNNVYYSHWLAGRGLACP